MTVADELRRIAKANEHMIQENKRKMAEAEFELCMTRCNQAALGGLFECTYTARYISTWSESDLFKQLFHDTGIKVYVQTKADNGYEVLASWYAQQ